MEHVALCTTTDFIDHDHDMLGVAPDLFALAFIFLVISDALPAACAASDPYKPWL